MRFKDTNVLFSEISSYLSLIVFITLITVLILLFLKVWRITRNLNQYELIEFKTYYSVLTESLKETKREKLIYYWKPLLLIRWSLTLLILIVLYDKPAFQILSLLSLSVIWQCLILFSKPFDSKAVNIISFYNELSVSVYLYLAFLLSDFFDTELLND